VRRREFGRVVHDVTMGVGHVGLRCARASTSGWWLWRWWPGRRGGRFIRGLGCFIYLLFNSIQPVTFSISEQKRQTVL